MPDFFAASKAIPALLYPLPLALIAVFALTFWKKNPVRWPVRSIVLALWIVASPWFSDACAQAWGVEPKTRAQVAPRYDVAIVLGGLSDPLTSNADHVEFLSSSERLWEAIALYREGRVRKILVTSGSGDLLHPDAREAPFLERAALQFGVARADLAIESDSRNTYENAVFSKPIAERLGKTYLLVTSSLHMKRSAAIFQKQGYSSAGYVLDLWPVDSVRDLRGFPFNAIPDAGSLAVVQSVLKEVAGYVVYAWMGYL